MDGEEIEETKAIRGIVLEDKREVKAPEGEDLIKKRAKSEERPTIRLNADMERLAVEGREKLSQS